MIIDEKEMEGYKIQVLHEDGEIMHLDLEVKKDDSEGAISNTSISSDEISRETKRKLNWLFWKKS